MNHTNEGGCTCYFTSINGVESHGINCPKYATTQGKGGCNCALLDKPTYHVSDDPHSVEKKWDCPEHGKQQRYWLIHTTPHDYCVPCGAPQSSKCWRCQPCDCPDQKDGHCPNCKFYPQTSNTAVEEVEKLSAEIHQLYCAQYLKDHGKPYWTEGDYSKLEERVKEYDRNIARWHLSRLTKLVEEAEERGRKEWENVNKQYLSREEAYAKGRREAIEECIQAVPKQSVIDEKIYPFPEFETTHIESDGWNTCRAETLANLNALLSDKTK